MTGGNENELKLACGFQQLLEFFFWDVVRTAVSSLKNKTVAFVLHKKILFSDLIHTVLDTVTAEMQPYGIISKDVCELLQGGVHLLYLDRIFCLPKTANHHFEFFAVIQKAHLFSNSLPRL